MLNRVQIAARLYEARDYTRRFYGDQFPAQVERWKPILAAVQKAEPEKGFLEAVIIAAKKMSDAGNDPTFLFGMAVEYLEPSIQKAKP